MHNITDIAVVGWKVMSVYGGCLGLCNKSGVGIWRLLDLCKKSGVSILRLFGLLQEKRCRYMEAGGHFV